MKTLTHTILAIALLSVSFGCLTSCSSHNSDDETVSDNSAGVPPLLERKTPIGTDAEKAKIKETYDKAVADLQAKPDDAKQYITLASVYIMEGRITGNNGYYSNAAMKVLNKVTENHFADRGLHFQALSLESAVLLNMHRFADALNVANSAVAINSTNSGIYGALVDANVELGNYDEAVKDCDRMLTIRPDLRSYSRASYLRQIYGDNLGAIAAMKMAVEAGVPGMESTEWARVNLGDLYLNSGKLDSAQNEYKTSLVYRPDYPHAEMGLAKVAKAQKNYDEAIAHTKTAIQTLSESAFVASLADLYELKGDTKKAAEIRSDVVNLLEEGERKQPKDALVKHNANRELATAYMNVNQLDKALQFAQNDLNMRPSNIDANELVAWIYYLKGDYANAKLHAEKTLVTNTKNPGTLFKDGMIYARAGEVAKGNEMMQQARAISPYIDQRILLASR